MQDSIIVYRNPLEKAFWEGGFLLPCLAMAVVFVLVFYFLLCFLEMITKKKASFMPTWCFVVAFLLSSSLAGLVFYYTAFFLG